MNHQQLADHLVDTHELPQHVVDELAADDANAWHDDLHAGRGVGIAKPEPKHAHR